MGNYHICCGIHQYNSDGGTVAAPLGGVGKMVIYAPIVFWLLILDAHPHNLELGIYIYLKTNQFCDEMHNAVPYLMMEL